ncbi:restriction endonuclease subunit S [Klebsiella pneumoniae]|uniref:restriction endonuclease subunit S n=1 Tax=Klebsiella pneumoniae TaxID=573 RepID=UPI001F06C15C|nr:restriction endonuclease subunit S [Klebsiella pneumoniae]MCQ8360372.1 restriction endonuclease subunit S [Klebsiella pneumoniae]UMI03212.1 restriction endonuclease subunit S [Klebsiella pneumoniae]HBR0796955.1 restriction endonuclease subunit S [Klebsiella pneumoniae]
MNDLSFPNIWLSRKALDCFIQISTNNRNVKTKDCKSEGLYPVIDQGQQFICGYIDDESKVIQVSNPLCVFGDHTRIIKWVTQDFVPGADGTKILEAEKFIFPKYGYYALRFIDIPDKGYSRHFKYLRELEIPISSLAEQKIIADKLDDLLARVESIKTRLENIPEILKKFRQSVLSAAVSGKLTESNDSLKSKESYQWSERKLSEVGLLSRGKSKHRPRNDPRLYGNNYPFIQTSEITNSFGRVKESKKFYSEFGLSQSKLFPKGTLCITIAANIADTAILDIDACFPDSIVGFIPYEEKANVIFIKYLIDVNKDYLEASAPATAQKNINLKVLSELKILLPSIEEQNRIVILVEDTLSQISFIERTTNDALNRVNHLTQSILAKAFRGELTAQWREENPELISGLNSAEALLEKITAEKLAAGTLKKRAKKTSH